MTVLIVMAGIVATVATIMYGIYRTTRIFDDNTSELRDTKRDHAKTLRDYEEALVKITRLEAELEREKAKIHDADQPE